MTNLPPDTLTRAKLFVGQQLPDLQKLEVLQEYLWSVRDGTVIGFMQSGQVTNHQLNEIVLELREKINELLVTEYATALLLLILPSLLNAKQTEA